MFGFSATTKKKPKTVKKVKKVSVSFKTKSGKSVTFKATKPKSNVKIVKKVKKNPIRKK